MSERVEKRALIGLFLLVLALGWAQLPPPVSAVGARSERTPAPSAPPTRKLTSTLPSADLVVLVSLDGLRPDAIQEDMRGMHKLSLQGASPQVARTIDKSATLPSHASMVSGVDPAQHGLDFNAYRPSQASISSPTVFSLAHAAGLPTAMFVGKAKLKHLLGKPSEAHFKMGGMLCNKLLTEALPYLREAERGLVFLHFADPDSAGHRSGWMTDEYIQAAYRADRCLERVIDTLEGSKKRGRTLLLVTSDHGGHGRSHGTRLDVDQRIPWYAWGAGVKRGRVSRPIHTTDTAATALSALGLQRPAAMHGKPVFEALGMGAGPEGLPLVGTPVEATVP